MFRRFRRAIAFVVLLSMPIPVLAALDAALCSEQGAGDLHVMAMVEDGSTASDHEQMDFGGVSVDTCAICHIGFAPIEFEIADRLGFHGGCVYVAGRGAACIEHDPSHLKRPPRTPLV